MSAEIEIQKFVETLVNKNETKMSLLDFFNNIHQKFFPDVDISFMQYFLELTRHKRKFVVHHQKLVDYGVVTSNRSSNMKQKLDTLRLVEDVDYSLLCAVEWCTWNQTYQSIYAYTRSIQKMSNESTETR